MSNEILKALADNPALFDAVKTLLVEQFHLDYNNMPIGVDDKGLGEIVHARMEGLKLVDEAFNKIAKYKSPPTQEQKRNEAR